MAVSCSISLRSDAEPVTTSVLTSASARSETAVTSSTNDAVSSACTVTKASWLIEKFFAFI